MNTSWIGACIYYGCTDSLAINYDPQQPSMMASCCGYTGSPCLGCTDSMAVNYDPYSTVDDGSCISSVYGCTDSLAINYNSNANVNNNTCYYCNITTTTITWMSSSLFADGFISVNPVSGTGPYSYTWSNGHNSSLNLNLCDTSYTYTVIDANGCGFTETIILTTYLGCTDSLALNYDPTAIVDDSSCIIAILVVQIHKL